MTTFAPFSHFYKLFLRPWLFNFDPELAHELAQALLPATASLEKSVRGLLGEFNLEEEAYRLKTQLAGETLAHPLGLAAGFDKNGRFVPYLGAMGFSYAEIGSVTCHASMGNPKPRLFRLVEDEAIINRMGLNGEGATAIEARLAQINAAGLGEFSYALNIARTNKVFLGPQEGIDDLLSCFNVVRKLSARYFTINVSCPNTHEGVLGESYELEAMLKGIKAMNCPRPLFLKLSPDTSEEFLEQVVALSKRYEIKGFVIGNTSLGRQGLNTSSAKIAEIGRGGLSGAPIFPAMLRLLRQMSRVISPQQELIACGGIDSEEKVLRALCAGASSVQLYSALVYGGPFLPIEIEMALLRRLTRANLTVTELVNSQEEGLRQLGLC
jgi:dihydroorotate dehydrogenase